jgi:hypothetical protein
VRLVPFGQIADNRETGAALLSVDNPGDAWNAFLKGDKSALAKDKIREGMLDRVDANTALFRDWKLQGPPFTLYRRPSDGQITAIVGKPGNTLEVLADLMRTQKVPENKEGAESAQSKEGAETAPVPEKKDSDSK